MDSELKTKWVAALRSGKYKQGKGCLRNEGQFCCLGVLADIIGAEWRYDRPWFDGNYGPIDYLPDHVLNDVGLTSLQQFELADMNDSFTRFNEIADHIETKL